MEQNMGFFDMSGVELVKKKYYNAAKVGELLENIRAEYDKLAKENQELKAQLESLSSQKNQISDTLMSARDIARHIIEDAKAQAEETAKLADTQAAETVRAAEKKAELILAGARSRKEASDADVSEVQEYALRCVEACVDKLRQQQKDSLEFLNAQWQDFLGGLILPEDSKARPAEFELAPAPAAETVQAQAMELPPQPVDWMAIADMELPELDDPYADIDAETFFSGAFFNEQTGGDIFSQLKSMMDSISPENEE